MALIKCPECGKEISDQAASCPNCGAPISRIGGTKISPNQQKQNINSDTNYPKKNSGLGIAALILSIIGCSFIIGAILAIIDLLRKDGKKKTYSIVALIFCAVWFFIFILFSSLGVTENSTISKNAESNTEENYGKIEDFSYELSGDSVILDKYNGNSEILEIKPSYQIDGNDYKTDLSNFQVGIGNSNVKTLIFDEEITSVRDAIFNSCKVEKVYFPKTIETVYDNTLSYLHPKDGETIKIYYGGTQEEWENIFTKYERTKLEDAKNAEEVGKSIGDKLNEIAGAEYDSSLFEYFFSSSPDDLK